MANQPTPFEKLKKDIKEIGKEKFLEILKTPEFAIVYVLYENEDLRKYVEDIEDRIDDIDLKLFATFGEIIRANYNQALVTNEDAKNLMELYHEDQRTTLRDLLQKRKKLADQRNLLIESAKKDYNDLMFNTIRASR